VAVKKEAKKDPNASTDTTDTSTSTVTHVAIKVRDYVKDHDECDWISEELFLNGKAWWSSFMFTVQDGHSEACVDDLCDLGVGASIAATKGGEPRGKGTILVMPARILRVGSVPKVLGNPKTLPTGEQLHYSPPPSVDNTPATDIARKSIADDAPQTSQMMGGTLDETQIKAVETIASDLDDAEVEEDDVQGQVSVKVSEGQGKDGSHWRKYTVGFNETIQSRVSVDSVVQYVVGASEFSFDYIMLIFNASVIACTGLVTNNTVVIVASMLVSPLMGPIMAVTFGAVIDHRALVKRGLFAETVGLVMWYVREMRAFTL